ncbi:unnamed protein product [Gongylonema pulchrum]|uniref:CSTF_C domain-containing protein n=1 Tax=Gongylonema pulchrum TaxID=637853 RepID=A0A183D172_9BILA|nr:unnamed protein product [Gongylonema pulchrum]
MAEAVLREPDTKEEIQRMHTERISALSQAAAATRVQPVTQLQQQSSALPTTPSLVTQTVSAPITIPLNPINVSQASVPPVPPISIPMPMQQQQQQPPLQAASNLLSPRSTQQLLLSAASRIPSFASNMPPSIMNVLPQIPTSLPNSNVPALSSSEREQTDVDQDDRYRRDDEGRYEADRDERIRRDRGRNNGRTSEKIDRDRDRDRRRGRSRYYSAFDSVHFVVSLK